MKIIRILNEEKFPSLNTSTTNRYLETVNSDLAPSFPRFLHNFSKYYPQIINVNKNFKTFIPKHKREKKPLNLVLNYFQHTEKKK